MILSPRSRFYIIRFFYIFSVSCTKTTFYLYFSEYHKLGHNNVLFIFAFFNIAVMLMEVPTAAIGEIIGVRKSFLIGLLLKIFAAVNFFIGTRLWHFCMAEIISALAVSFISGSLNAWLISQLGEIKESSMSHIFIVGKRITTCAMALGGVLGAIIGREHLGLPWLLVFVGITITFIMSLKLLTKPEEKINWKRKEKVFRKWQTETILHGYRLSLKNRILLVILFNSFLVSFALAAPKIGWIPMLKDSFSKNAGNSSLFCVGDIKKSFINKLSNASDSVSKYLKTKFDHETKISKNLTEVPLQKIIQRLNTLIQTEKLWEVINLDKNILSGKTKKLIKESQQNKKTLILINRFILQDYYKYEIVRNSMWFIANIWLCITAIQFIGTFGLKTLFKWLPSALTLKLIFTIFSFLMLLGVVICKNSIALFVLFYLLLELAKPYHRTLIITLIQKETTSQGRLTILSLENLASKIGNTLGLCMAGIITQANSVSFAWSIGLILYSLAIPCFFYLMIKENENKRLKPLALRINVDTI